MATLSSNLLLTARDLEILTALDRCPLTAEQFLKLSQTFAVPFTDERRVRERLQQLVAAGRVRRWLYATAGRGALGYYTLSRLGHLLLRGDEEAAAARRAFGPVGIARQFHTLRLADFIVHTATSAHRAGLKLSGFYRENAFRLTVGQESLYPDCAFQLVTPSGFPFSFFVELDNSTEAIRSDKDRESWQRKLRLYDALRPCCSTGRPANPTWPPTSCRWPKNLRTPPCATGTSATGDPQTTWRTRHHSDASMRCHSSHRAAV